ncbi:MAG: hypothetical protein BroJett040_15450 [Oligoflexia bacterium]|nr:MAG: hypothetical protein BroJett040_15450 [Oligoflexia bacterium]
MRLFLFSLIAILALTSCQAYKSAGRKQFESRAPDSLVTPEIGAHQIVEKNGLSCWTQPATEALWFFEENQTYQVQSIENSQIEVCFEDHR